MTNDDERRLFFEILNGEFNNLPEQKSNIVRIFFSSTFSGIKL